MQSKVFAKSQKIPASCILCVIDLQTQIMKLLNMPFLQSPVLFYTSIYSQQLFQMSFLYLIFLNVRHQDSHSSKKS